MVSQMAHAKKLGIAHLENLYNIRCNIHVIQLPTLNMIGAVITIND